MTAAETLPAPGAPPAGGSGTAAIEVVSVSQTYPGVQALTAVSLLMWPGEVVGLVGHNGAGKSTLTRIIAGVERPTRGQVRVRGEAVSFHGPQDAIAAGICVVPQAMSIVPNLTLHENISLGTPIRTAIRRRGAPSKSELDAQIERVASQLGIDSELRDKAGRCPPSVQRLAMVGRALLRRPAVILLDEPTAALHPKEADRMFAAVKSLGAAGVAILFIGHRLEEVLRVSSRLIVMRQGKVIAEEAASNLSNSRLAELVAGRGLEQQPAARRGAAGSAGEREVILRCEDMRLPPLVRGVSLTAARGEVVGLAGLEGSGCTEVLQAVAGLVRPFGSVTLHGRHLPHSRRAAIELGIAYLPGDRVHTGIIPEMTVAETVTLSHDQEFRLSRWLPLLRVRREAEVVDRLLERLDLHPRGAARNKIKSLSGGNQQKALMARALIAGADVYLFDQPTEGVDVGARQELHKHVRRLADEGGSVLVTSQEPEELVELCDRVIVMRDGCIVCELLGGEMTEAEIVHASLVGGAEAAAAS